MHVLRHLRAEEDAHPLGADHAYRLDDRVEEGVGRVREEQVRLVEEEDELGLLEIADLRQLLEELREQPHERGRPESRLVLDGRQLEARDDAASVGRYAQEIGHVQLGLAEELRAAAVLDRDELAQQDADRRGGDAADALQRLLARIRVEVGEQRAQVGEIEQREAGLVREAENEREALLLRVVRLEYLPEQLRAEVGDGCTNGHARADAAERVELDRKTLRLVGEAQLGHPLGSGPVGCALLRQPGEVALHVGGEDSYPGS